MEQEIYIDKISKEYSISKEAISAEINKLLYSGSQGAKGLEKKKKIMDKPKEENESNINPDVIKRENMVIYLLMNHKEPAYEKLKAVIEEKDFKDERNQKILKKLYEELEKGNSNTNQIINQFEEENIISHLTEIMAYDFEITDVNKAVEDLLYTYEKEKLVQRRNELVKQIDEGNSENKDQLEKELNEVFLQLAKKK